MTHDKVTDLNTIKMKRRGEAMFLGCPCGEDGGFAVVVIAARDAPAISALICLACEEEHPVAFGKLAG